MCGIVGYFGADSRRIADSMEQLLLIDVIRGPHSTGVAFLRPNTHPKIWKNAGLPHHLLADKKVQLEFSCFNSGYIGHNRFATKGAINTDNAHPFRFGEVTGVHNGTVHLLDAYPDHKKFNTDSQCIVNAINEIGIVDTWAELRGAAALVWWDDYEKSYNIIRNNQRPLSFVWTKDKRGVYISSEAWMVQGVAQRNKIALGEIVELKPNDHHTFYKEKGGVVGHEQHTLKPYNTFVAANGRFPNYDQGPKKQILVWSKEENRMVPKDYMKDKFDPTAAAKKSLAKKDTGVTEKDGILYITSSNTAKCVSCLETVDKNDGFSERLDEQKDTWSCGDCAEMIRNYNLKF